MHTAHKIALSNSTSFIYHLNSRTLFTADRRDAAAAASRERQVTATAPPDKSISTFTMLPTRTLSPLGPAPAKQRDAAP